MVKKIPKEAVLLGSIETSTAKISLYENLEAWGSARIPRWYAQIEHSDEWLANLDRTSLKLPTYQKVEIKKTDSITKIQQNISELKKIPDSKYIEY